MRRDRVMTGDWHGREVTKGSQVWKVGALPLPT